VRGAFYFEGAVVAALAACPAVGNAADRIEQDRPPPWKLVLGAELELVDVDGEGGFENRDISPVRPDTRSPYASLDRATVELRAPFERWLSARVRIRADDDNGYVDRALLEGEPWTDRLRFEVGLSKPFFGVERKTETYSTLGAAFWRGREYHLGLESRVAIGPIDVVVAGSAAQQRPLGNTFPSEDEALSQLGFDHSRIDESSPTELGTYVHVDGFGATVGAFAEVGELHDNADLLTLQRIFPGYARAAGSSTRLSYWYGVRGEFDAFGLFLHIERLRAQQGLVSREGFEAALSYTVPVDVAGRHLEVEPIVRWSELATINFREEYLVPQSWDRTQLLFGMLFRPLPGLEVKVERVFNGERTGPSREGRRGVENDETLIQLNLEISHEI
jgi:hypothetical protein